MSVRHALLALLSEGPKYGFQLRQEFEEGTGDVWPLNIGQVYSTLQRLEHSGHIESDDLADEGPQKVFRLTEEANAELARLDSVIRWLDQAEGRLMRAELEPAVPSTVPRLRRRLVARR